MAFTPADTNMTTTTTLTKGMQTYYNRLLLEDKESVLVHQQFCKHYPFPKNSGTTMNIRKFLKIRENTTALTEGNPGNPTTMVETETTLSIRQYGDWMQTSDWIDMVHLDMNLEERVKLMGNAGLRSVDSLVRAVMENGNNIQYAMADEEHRPITSVDGLTAKDVLTTRELRKAVRFLKNKHADPFADGLYVAIITPDIIFDLQDDPQFVAVSQYQDKENIYRGEIGKLNGLYGVRLVETTIDRVNPKTNTGSVPYMNVIVLGKDAVADTDLEGANPHVIVKPAGSAGTADPLNQISTVGWKLSGYGAGILEGNNMVNIMCAYSV